MVMSWLAKDEKFNFIKQPDTAKRKRQRIRLIYTDIP